MATDAKQRVTDELARQQAAISAQQCAYAGFLAAAQRFDWPAAAEYQLQFSAASDAAMDAFVRACRAMEEASSGSYEPDA